MLTVSLCKLLFQSAQINDKNIKYFCFDDLKMFENLSFDTKVIK